MPPRVAHPGGRFRRVVSVGLLLVVAGGVYAFFSVGRWLAPQTPLEKADAIFVLAGTVAERPLEAADLFLGGYAPRILITRDTPEPAAIIAATRGASLPQRYELNRDLLLRLGVPAEALILPERIHDNTSSEAQTLREVALQMGWKKVIVVSSTYHLRRVAIACRRQLKGTNVQVVLHATRYDPAAPDRWWTRRSDIRWVVSEVPKVIAYALRLGA